MEHLDIAGLKRVAQNIESANGLPNAFYTSDEAFQAERQKVFREGWFGIGFGQDVPNPGDAKPIDILGLPLLLLRDKDGQVRVFQNVCRHRGMTLVSEPTNVGSFIVCPYHAWCYGLDGGLRGTPHVGGPGVNRHPSIQREGLGLLEVRSHTWLDTVFVNPSRNAPDFEEHAAALFDHWPEFKDQPIFPGGADSQFSLEVQSNWKLPVENYCESYHLPWVHPGLNSYSRLEDHYHIMEPGAFSGQGTLVYDPKLDDSGRAFPSFAGLSAKWDSAAEYIALYPNVLMGVHRDHVYSIILEPVSPERTIERISISYASEDAAGPEFANLRARNTALWKEVFQEDVFAVEGMQRGRHAPGFDGGRFSPVMDAPTHCFHHWLASRFVG